MNPSGAVYLYWHEPNEADNAAWEERRRQLAAERAADPGPEANRGPRVEIEMHPTEYAQSFPMHASPYITEEGDIHCRNCGETFHFERVGVYSYKRGDDVRAWNENWGLKIYNHTGGWLLHRCLDTLPDGTVRRVAPLV
jgi:hypothetical protein